MKFPGSKNDSMAYHDAYHRIKEGSEQSKLDDTQPKDALIDGYLEGLYAGGHLSNLSGGLTILFLQGKELMDKVRTNIEVMRLRLQERKVGGLYDAACGFITYEGEVSDRRLVNAFSTGYSLAWHWLNIPHPTMFMPVSSDITDYVFGEILRNEQGIKDTCLLGRSRGGWSEA